VRCGSGCVSVADCSAVSAHILRVADPDVDDDEDDDKYLIKSDDEEQFACTICRGPFRNAVETTCVSLAATVVLLVPVGFLTICRSVVQLRTLLLRGVRTQTLQEVVAVLQLPEADERCASDAYEAPAAVRLTTAASCAPGVFNVAEKLRLKEKEERETEADSDQEAEQDGCQKSASNEQETSGGWTTVVESTEG
jgi:hypothetical protein